MNRSEPLTTTKYSALAHPALGSEGIGSLAKLRTDLSHLRIRLQSELRPIGAKGRLMQAGGDQWITQQRRQERMLKAERRQRRRQLQVRTYETLARILPKGLLLPRLLLPRLLLPRLLPVALLPGLRDSTHLQYRR